jgi:hypothetical protein
MSIMDIFRKETPPSAAPNSQAANPTIPNENTPKSDGTVAAIPAAATGDKSPLDGYKELWDAKNDPKSIDLNPGLSADPTKLVESAKNIDFTRHVSQELLDKAAGGDKTALQQVVQDAARAGLVYSTAATTEIVNRALEQQSKKFRDEILPEAIRKSVIQQTDSAIKIPDNPATAPMVAMIENRLIASNPTASATEIKRLTQEYLTAFAGEIVNANGAQVVAVGVNGKTNPLARKEEDWSTFFGDS